MLFFVLILLILPFSIIVSEAKDNKGYGFKYKGIKVMPGDDASKFLKKVGKASKTTRYNSCLTDGYDYTYKFKNFTLSTYTKNKNSNAVQYVSSIELTSKGVKTLEGIKLGSSEKQVKKKYKNAKKSYGIYTKAWKKTKILISVKNKKVISIMICEK